MGRGMKKLMRAFRHRIMVSGKTEREIIDSFHKLYYHSWHAGTRKTMPISWMGADLLKTPLDLWVYQEIIFERKPDLLVETGTRFGGSALFFASLFDLMGKGRVLTIDTEEDSRRPSHDRITYLKGSSTAPEMVARVREEASSCGEVMVILDSDHSRAHVREELDCYHDLVPEGGYLIVEDTNVNGHPVHPDFGPGPMEAAVEFLDGNPGFVADREREKFMMTCNPGGFLRRVKKG